MPSKKYIISQVDGYTSVYVAPDDGVPYPLPHHGRDADRITSWATGYAGASPQELSLSILLDFFEELEPDPPSTGAARRLYRAFTLDFIAPIPDGTPEVVIEAGTIEQWVHSKEG